ncbi:hypothetical protein SNOG_08077 [Parastagonospora nodorum SN15]|uniref:Uncharacterized protein n=1 Tax=Phaeosphaeria nodorum (strain SN15 / ATCC MYA-4574 / FGSC 10173) TaxID=321614 RepID=Q0UJI7_PHANO|nr:hypothetical protein SNOG_08077 [Parastagonospora nodorum SN15]EAT84353.1 hypothetical protein SNOG_08077 [Parastagonospora nodorum SN15]
MIYYELPDKTESTRENPLRTSGQAVNLAAFRRS